MNFLKEVCVNEMDKNINIENHSKDTNMEIERVWVFWKTIIPRIPMEP